MRYINANQLKQFDGSLTVKELIAKLEQENKAKEAKNEETKKKVIEAYSGKFLKVYDPHGLFGESLDIYKIDELKFTSYNTEYEMLYGFNGTKISFSKRDLSMFDISSSECRYHFSEKDLKEATIIGLEEYQTYVEEYERITTSLKNLLKK